MNMNAPGIFTRQVPKVNGRLLEKALNLYSELGTENSLSMIAMVCAAVIPSFSFEKGKLPTARVSQQTVNLTTRFTALHDVLYRKEHHARIVKEKQFPFEWIKIASKAPLTAASG